MKKETKRGLYLLFFLLLLLVFVFSKYNKYKSNSLVEKEKKSVEREWNLILVNSHNRLEKDYKPDLLNIEGSEYLFDKRAIFQLEKMLEDSRKEGLNPLIVSAYRSWEKQEELYKGQVEKQKNLGFPEIEAKKRAKSVVAYPGHSEHQLGLAVDIVSLDYPYLEEKQEESLEFIWLKENSYKYGFILRYPKDKSHITGIIYEPWHFRYVGKDAAENIYMKKISLEEYLKDLIKE